MFNDDESELHHDYEVSLEKLAPHAPVEQYRHNGYEDNADAHLNRQIILLKVVTIVLEDQAAKINHRLKMVKRISVQDRRLLQLALKITVR